MFGLMVRIWAKGVRINGQMDRWTDGGEISPCVKVPLLGRCPKRKGWKKERYSGNDVEKDMCLCERLKKDRWTG